VRICQNSQHQSNRLQPSKCLNINWFNTKSTYLRTKGKDTCHQCVTQQINLNLYQFKHVEHTWGTKGKVPVTIQTRDSHQSVSIACTVTVTSYSIIKLVTVHLCSNKTCSNDKCASMAADFLSMRVSTRVSCMVVHLPVFQSNCTLVPGSVKF
jgi:hypothetical protein